MSKPFELMEAGDDGWSEWRRPLPGYLMKCCDCGLVHEMEFAIVRQGKALGDGYFESEDVDDPSILAMFRARRVDGEPDVALGEVIDRVEASLVASAKFAADHHGLPSRTMHNDDDVRALLCALGRTSTDWS